MKFIMELNGWSIYKLFIKYRTNDYIATIDTIYYYVAFKDKLNPRENRNLEELIEEIKVLK
jgi:hypothetical protein